MRILFGFLLAAAFLAGEAEASSIVAIEPLSTKLGPSMIQLGATPSIAVLGAAPRTPDRTELTYPYPSDSTAGAASSFQPEPVRISASILAMGEPPVAMEQVAAIDPEPKRRGHEALPLVIRGGVLGDAFTRAAPPTVVPVAATDQQQASSGAPGTPKMPDPAPEPVAPAPAPTPPSTPTRQPE